MKPTIFILVLIIALVLKIKTRVPHPDRSVYPIPTSNFFKKKKVVITGLVRDSENTLESSLLFLYSQVLPHFEDYLILVLENGSTDKTREILMNHSKKDPKLQIIEVQNDYGLVTAKTGIKAFFSKPSRINKMVLLRNMCVDEVKKDKYDSYDFVALYDFDINGSLSVKGIESTGYFFEQDPTIDAISVLGITKRFGTYYDPYAHEDYGEEWNYKSKPLLYWFKQMPKAGIVKVNSSFGGLMFYKRSSYIKYRYSTYKKNLNEIGVVCEHVPFNHQMKNIYENHDMVFYI